MSTKVESAALRATSAAHGPAPLDAFATLWMVGLTFLWGANALSIKVVTLGMSPLMATALRGAVALPLLTAYGRLRKERLAFSGADLRHGLVNGLIFAVEFGLFYSGARLTSAGHIAIFINTAPFFVAIGAHYFLPGDRMHAAKALGLILALAGIAVMFSNDILIRHSSQWRGDVPILAAAGLWGLNTLYAKRYLARRMSAFRMLYSQVLVSTPLLLAASLALEPRPFFAATAVTWFMLLFQAVATVCFSYMVWMMLVQRYSASAMQSFTFLSPAWGVLLGVIVLGEELQALLVVGIALVGFGIALVNRPPRRLGRNASPPARAKARSPGAHA